MVLLGKQRKTTVETVRLVAGYYEVLERDKKGRPTRQKWLPQFQTAADGTKTPITVELPIEEQFNNGRGVDFYRHKGYLPLDEAEEKLLRDFPDIKFEPSVRQAAQPVAPVAPAAPAVDPSVLTPKQPEQPHKPAETTTKPRRKR